MSEIRELYPWQQITWETLCRQLGQQRLPHALLLQGQADSGLDAFALLIAQRLLCTTPVDDFPCGKCRGCQWWSASTHGGFLHVIPETNDKGVLSKVIRIDQIRAVIELVTQTAMQGGRKVVMIAPAEAMNANAANALLKSLEEPPANTFFILVSHNPGRLMATIRSRCQTVDVALPATPVADQWLTPLLPESAKRRELLSLSGNNPLLVQRWLTEGKVETLLGLGAELERVWSGKQSPVQLAAAWIKTEAVALRVNWWWRWLALQLKQQAPGGQQVFQHVPDVTLLRIHAFMQKLLTAKRHLESSANPNEQLLLESLLIDWQSLAKP